MFTDAAGLVEFDRRRSSPRQASRRPSASTRSRPGPRSWPASTASNCTRPPATCRWTLTGTNQRTMNTAARSASGCALRWRCWRRLTAVWGAQCVGCASAPATPSTTCTTTTLLRPTRGCCGPWHHGPRLPARHPLPGCCIDAFALAQACFAGPRILNDGFDFATGNAAVAAGVAAAISYARGFIANPDLVGASSTDCRSAFDRKTLYSPGAEGYTTIRRSPDTSLEPAVVGAVPDVDLGRTAVGAEVAEVTGWKASGCPRRGSAQHFPDDDRVVTPGVHRVHAAVEAAQRPVKVRGMRVCAPVQVHLELVRRAPGEMQRQVALLARSTCTAKAAPGAKADRLLLLFVRHHSSSGGSSDTELKEFAVTPTGSPSGRTAVTTVTPVANSPKASRSCRWLNELRVTPLYHALFTSPSPGVVPVAPRASRDTRAARARPPR